MAPLSFLVVFLPYGGEVSRTVRDGDNLDGARLDSTLHRNTSKECIPPALR
jgi:hypothetical protein